MKKSAVVIAIILGAIFSIQSCRKDKVDTNIDPLLFDEINSGAYTYYQNGTILSGAAPSPHGTFKLRFNATAATALDSTGELPIGGTFPDGSVLVKELYTGSNLILYVVMKKDPSNINAASSWVWAEFNTDGSARYTSANKGAACINCHSGSPNRDLTRTFDLH